MWVTLPPVCPSGVLMQALVTHPPTMVAAAWLAVDGGAGEWGVQQAMNRAYQRHMQVGAKEQAAGRGAGSGAGIAAAGERLF